MSKKIAVLGPSRVMDYFMRPVENPGDFILVKDITSVAGYDISHIIWLSGWISAYPDPIELRKYIENRIR